MEMQRTVTILLPNDPDLLATVKTFQQVQQVLSEPCYNDGKPLGAIDLQKQYYYSVKGKLNSQMTISAMRIVAGCYRSAKSNKRPATKPFGFYRARALFLVGQRGRDAEFRADGTLSIWTVAGRKRLNYRVPEDFAPTLEQAKEIDSLNVIECNGQLLGRVTLTLEAPEPQGILPVGIDLNETNALVAVDADNRELFISGRDIKVKNIRTRKTRSRLQRKLATHKAERRDTRSVRRRLKRLGRKQGNRTRTFAQQTAKKLLNWAPFGAVLIFEDLHMPKVSKKLRMRKGVRRRLSQWQHNLMRQCLTNKAQERGMLVEYVNPRYTSQDCSRCGLRGLRQKHRFACPHCFHVAHADVNAAYNIRNRFTTPWSREPLSVGSEALELSSEGKLTPYLQVSGSC